MSEVYREENDPAWQEAWDDWYSDPCHHMYPDDMYPLNWRYPDEEPDRCYPDDYGMPRSRLEALRWKLDGLQYRIRSGIHTVIQRIYWRLESWSGVEYDPFSDKPDPTWIQYLAAGVLRRMDKVLK